MLILHFGVFILRSCCVLLCWPGEPFLILCSPVVRERNSIGFVQKSGKQQIGSSNMNFAAHKPQIGELANGHP